MIARTWKTLHKSSYFDYEKIIVRRTMNPRRITLSKSNSKQSLNTMLHFPLPLFICNYLNAFIHCGRPWPNCAQKWKPFYSILIYMWILRSKAFLFYFILFFHLLTTAWNLNSENCNPLIFGKDRDWTHWSKATLFHNWSMKESERNCNGKF